MSHKIKILVYNLLIIIILFISAEIIATILFKEEFVNLRKRILIYSENKVFKNFDDIFLLKKNSEFVSSTFYFDNDYKKIVNEYSYLVSTNNEGLVQKKDVKPNKKTIFILGASETKGQGAVPWFYDLENLLNIGKNYQILNIGFIGTGPAQQIKIMNLIKEKYNLEVEKIIFIITQGELNRNIWNFNDQQLRCLKNHLKCIGTENIYGYNFALGKELEFAKKIYAIKGSQRNKLEPFFNALSNGNYFQAIKELSKNSYLIKKIYLSLFKSKSMLNDGALNIESIKKLTKQYNAKIHILHPSIRNQINYKDSELLVRMVKNLNLENNYHYCQLPSKSGFHKNDSHPNKMGYSVLKNCLIEFLNLKF